MFTSRAEYRLLLREDNADLRLTEAGRDLGLVDDERWRSFEEKSEAISAEQQRLASTWIAAGALPADVAEEDAGTAITQGRQPAAAPAPARHRLRRPGRPARF